MNRNRRTLRRTALAALLLMAAGAAAGCTGLQHWGEDWESLGPAFSEWGTDIFGDTSPEW